MQRTDKTDQAQSGRRKIQSSTTLNRKYVRRPRKNMKTKEPAMPEVVTPDVDIAVAVERSPKIQRFGGVVQQPMQPTTKMPQAKIETKTEIMKAEVHPLQNTTMTRMRSRKIIVNDETTRKKTTARELKDRAIKQALASAATSETTPKTTAKAKTTRKKSKGLKVHFGFGRVMLALSCAAVAVFAIVYFVNLSMPDVSLKVAAMQTGIDAAYPNYVPRDYSISSITSENKKIVLEFKNSTSGGAFTITEEASSWDSNALLSNYVKDTYGDNYTIVKEQGLSIYISGSNASWVNGGVAYKINTTSGSLTNKQIRSIATSL